MPTQDVSRGIFKWVWQTSKIALRTLSHPMHPKVAKDKLMKKLYFERYGLQFFLTVDSVYKISRALAEEEMCRKLRPLMALLPSVDCVYKALLRRIEVDHPEQYSVCSVKFSCAVIEQHAINAGFEFLEMRYLDSVAETLNFKILYINAKRIFLFGITFKF